MNAIALAAPRVSLARCYALEGKYEFLRVLRTPAFAVPTLLFPPLFYLLFGDPVWQCRWRLPGKRLSARDLQRIRRDGRRACSASASASRSNASAAGWRSSASQPMPPGAYLLAKMAMAMLFALIISISRSWHCTLGGVRLPAAAWLLLGVVAVLGVLPFCALGLLIGSRVNASAAPAVINLIYLPMAFLSGLWMPLAILPPFIAKIAPLWPAYHLGRLALGAVGQAPGESWPPHVIALAAVTIVFVALARRRLARAGCAGRPYLF